MENEQDKNDMFTQLFLYELSSISSASVFMILQLGVIIGLLIVIAVKV